MTLSRRRFLTISAAFAAAPRAAAAHSWQGHAFGAEVSLSIRGQRDQAVKVLGQARHLIREIEGVFSLYDPASALSRLNVEGVLVGPGNRFLELMQACDRAYRLTGGLFDPTVQPLWRSYAEGRKPHEYVDLLGWDRVQFGPDRISLDAGQALTFNGIAQGYATDKVAELLAAQGLRDVLVNIGEHRAIGGPWRIGLADPDHGLLGQRTLTTGAIATSSVNATPLGSAGHILHASAQPQWSSVSVEAPSATLADSLSTALVLAPFEQVEAVRAAADISRVTLVDFEGNLSSV